MVSAIQLLNHWGLGGERGSMKSFLFKGDNMAVEKRPLPLAFRSILLRVQASSVRKERKPKRIKVCVYFSPKKTPERNAKIWRECEKHQSVFWD